MKTVKKLELKWKRVQLKNRKDNKIYKKQLACLADFLPFVRGLLEDEVNEVFLTFYINVDFEIIGYQETGRGGNTQVNAPVSDIIRGALLVGAAGIAVAHNHTSASNSNKKPTPSPNDTSLTIKLKKATDFFNLIFIDHVIVGDRKHFSFRKDSHLLECVCEKCREKIVVNPSLYDRIKNVSEEFPLDDEALDKPLTPKEEEAFEILLNRFEKEGT